MLNPTHLVAGILLTLGMHSPLAWSLATSQLAAQEDACRCACVEGLPQTLCGSIQAAQQQRWVCPPSVSCPMPSSTLDGQVQFDPPGSGATNCRAVRVWHRQRQAYTGIKFCDVQDPSP